MGNIVRDFLAFQEFKPLEAKCVNYCIWCRKNNPTDRSHIVSKKLTISNHTTNILRKSICASCNREFSKLELWILRNTPLGWVRLFFYPESNISSNTEYIFSYFYDNKLHEWILFTLDGSKKKRNVMCQLILMENKPMFISEYAPDNASLYYSKIINNIKNDDIIEYIENDLPDDFSPRGMIIDNKVTIVSKDAYDLLKFKEYINKTRFEKSHAKHTKLTDDGRQFQHFKWSKENWIKLCAKVSFETLCLFEGSEFCLLPNFDQVRSYAMSSISKHSKKLIFNEHGPIKDSHTPLPVFVDLSKGQNCPRPLKAPLLQSGLGEHTLAIYEINGWICASISIAGFPPSFLVLGGPGVHLNDFYITQYDIEEDEFHYLKLAYDPQIPVIPIQIGSGQIDEIAKTYNLKNI